MATKTKPKTRQEGAKLTARDVLVLKTAELTARNAEAALNEAHAQMSNIQLKIMARLKLDPDRGYDFKVVDDENVWLIPKKKDDNGRA